MEQQSRKREKRGKNSKSLNNVIIRNNIRKCLIKRILVCSMKIKDQRLKKVLRNSMTFNHPSKDNCKNNITLCMSSKWAMRWREIFQEPA